MRYYIRHRRDVQGPFEEDSIKEWIAEGRVRKEMEFSEDGETWTAGRRHELFEGGGLSGSKKQVRSAADVIRLVAGVLEAIPELLFHVSCLGCVGTLTIMVMLAMFRESPTAFFIFLGVVVLWNSVAILEGIADRMDRRAARRSKRDER